MALRQPTLQSKLAAAQAAKSKCARMARSYRAKAALYKPRAAAKMYTPKAKIWEAKEEEVEVQMMQLATDIEAARVKYLLEANKYAIVAMFQAVLGGAQAQVFAHEFERDPIHAVTVTLHDLAKAAQTAGTGPTGRDAREFGGYKWNGCDPWIVPEEAVLLLIPALARCPHMGPAKALEIAHERLATLGIGSCKNNDDAQYPGWCKSDDGQWDAQLSAFVRDIVPVLPGIKQVIDKCTGCETCLVARRRFVESVIRRVRSQRAMKRNVLLLLLC